MDFSFFNSIKDLEKELSSEDLDEDLDEDLGEDLNNNTDLSKIDISSYSSKKLCEIIVSYRYLGLNKNLAVLSMNELGMRRDLGDPTDFEHDIEIMLADLPQIDIKMPDLKNFISIK